jgi:hypothetical protein
MRDDVRIDAVLEAEDTLAVRLKSLSATGPRKSGEMRETLQRQTRAILEGAGWFEGGLALIEVDGVSNAALIRSSKPSDGRYVQIVLRNGDSIQLETIGGAAQLSRENYQKLLERVSGLLRNS